MMKTNSKNYFAGHDYFQHLRNIRESYINLWSGCKGQDPYKFDEWFEWLTPIERNVWNDIRYMGIPMYGQFPVGKYYLDFADPFIKFGIEVDGTFHDEIKHRQKDAERTHYLKSLGWTILRIKGKTTYTSETDFEYSDYEMERYGHETRLRPEYWTQCSEGILRRVVEDVYLPMWRKENKRTKKIKTVRADKYMKRHKMTAQKIKKNKKLFGYAPTKDMKYNYQK